MDGYRGGGAGRRRGLLNFGYSTLAGRCKTEPPLSTDSPPPAGALTIAPRRCSVERSNAPSARYGSNHLPSKLPTDRPGSSSLACGRTLWVVTVACRSLDRSVDGLAPAAAAGDRGLGPTRVSVRIDAGTVFARIEASRHRGSERGRERPVQEISYGSDRLRGATSPWACHPRAGDSSAAAAARGPARPRAASRVRSRRR